jgi:NitT/TauT family transport system ATP-binding protein
VVKIKKNENLLELRNISKSFSEKKVLNNFNLIIKENEIVTIFGPNGVGKTTILNLIAGIIIPDKGNIFFNQNNNVGFVFQNYRDSLLPWKNNLDNIAFPFELIKMDIKKRRNIVINEIKKLKLKIPLYQYPYESSGGEQQLISILREVLIKPSILLMDEPFSALNIDNKIYLKKIIQYIKKKLNLTIIIVTHDLKEAIQLGDRLILISNKGNILSEFDINFKKPRSEELLYSKRFLFLENKIRQSYFNGEI